MWQQMSDGTIVRHPDGYITMSSRFGSPVTLAVFNMKYNRPPNFPICPILPKQRKLEITNPTTTAEVQDSICDNKSKCLIYRRNLFHQQREQWATNYKRRKEQRKKRTTTTTTTREEILKIQIFRGKENVLNAKRPASDCFDCPLESCPKKVKLLKKERQLDKKFRKNEKSRLYNRYPGYKSSSEESDPIVSQISNDYNRRSRSPITFHYN